MIPLITAGTSVSAVLTFTVWSHRSVDAVSTGDVGYHKIDSVDPRILFCLKVEHNVFVRRCLGFHIIQVAAMIDIQNPLFTTLTLPVPTLVLFRGPVLPLKDPLTV
jgi:hypothetical protein